MTAPQSALQPASRHLVPSGACDCHSHIYGPFDRYPLPAGAAAPPATLAQYEALTAALGVERAVFVQALAYGTDHSAMLDAMAAWGPERARGVAVLQPDVTDAELQQLSASGVCGVRIMTTEPGALSLPDAPAMARRVASLGWHLQIQGDGRTLEESIPVIRSLPTTVVIDHVGRLPPGDGTRSAAFRCLLNLLETGRVWVKLSAFYYGFTAGTAPMAEVAERVKALADARPDRLIWGLNWPHPRYAPGHKPDDVALFEAFLSWLPPATLTAVLADNPAALYGFSGRR